MANYLEQSLAKLKEFEGCVPWMYRDTVGKVTVGVGLMLPDEAAAQGLGFAVGGEAANAEEVAAEFARVMALPEGRAAAFYRCAASLELPAAVIDAKLLTVLAGFEAALQGRLQRYDAMPQDAKLALLDMAYNLGPERLFQEYPRMMRAVMEGAWAQAAAQCMRQGPGAARNAWTRAMLLAAAAGGEMKAVEAEAEGWLGRLKRWVRTVLRW